MHITVAPRTRPAHLSFGADSRLQCTFAADLTTAHRLIKNPYALGQLVHERGSHDAPEGSIMKETNLATNSRGPARDEALGSEAARRTRRWQLRHKGRMRGEAEDIWSDDDGRLRSGDGSPCRFHHGYAGSSPQRLDFLAVLATLRATVAPCKIAPAIASTNPDRALSARRISGTQGFGRAGDITNPPTLHSSAHLRSGT